MTPRASVPYAPGSPGVPHVPDPADSSALALQLRLVRRHGSLKNEVLVIPASGAGMAQALELGGERMSEAQWREASQCRIGRVAHGWQLRNDSRSLVCAVNGQRVLANKAVPLAPGDTLEIGLLRFEIDMLDQNFADAAAPLNADNNWPRADESPPAANAGGPNPVNPADQINQAEAEFDLRDLAVPAHDFVGSDKPGLHQKPGYADAGRLNSPFGVLDIAGAERRLASDSLAELLGEAPKRAKTPALRDAGVQAVQGVQAAPVSSGTQLFSELNAEFERVVRDPSQLNGRADWDGLMVQADGRTTTLEDLSREATPYPLLRDILQTREGIDAVLQSFDSSGLKVLTVELPVEDVLRLFAPTLASGAKTAIPSLTQREHHDMAPDSYMSPGTRRGKDRSDD